MTTCEVIIKQKLYMIKCAYISCWIHIIFFERNVASQVYILNPWRMFLFPNVRHTVLSIFVADISVSQDLSELFQMYHHQFESVRLWTAVHKIIMHHFFCFLTADNQKENLLQCICNDFCLLKAALLLLSVFWSVLNALPHRIPATAVNQDSF